LSHPRVDLLFSLRKEEKNSLQKANCGKKETIKGVFPYALFKEVFRKALSLGAATRRSLRKE
jgi:hypothetical protein